MAAVEAPAAPEDGKSVCAFVKAKKAKGNLRKRKEEDFAVEDDSAPAVVTKKEKTAQGPLVASTQQFKKEKDLFMYTSNPTQNPAGSQDQKATAHIEIDTEHDRDATAVEDRRRKMQYVDGQKLEEGQVLTGDEVQKYHGLKAYTEYVDIQDRSGMAKGTGIKAGPVRGSQYARAICRFDYQPDICKDYKETGFCSYGDNCKFMHDRGDYKTGWQLENEWAEEQKMKKEFGSITEQNFEIHDEDFPFACAVCREYFKDPVKTRCKHYFCERCILKQTKCPVCGENTSGLFSKLTTMEKKKLEESVVRHEKQLAENPPQPPDQDDGDDYDPDELVTNAILGI